MIISCCRHWLNSFNSQFAVLSHHGGGARVESTRHHFVGASHILLIFPTHTHVALSILLLLLHYQRHISSSCHVAHEEIVILLFNTASRCHWLAIASTRVDYSVLKTAHLLCLHFGQHGDTFNATSVILTVVVGISSSRIGAMEANFQISFFITASTTNSVLGHMVLIERLVEGRFVCFCLSRLKERAGRVK